MAQADNCVCRMGGIIFLGEGYRISPNNAYACNISVYKLCDMQGSIKEGRGGWFCGYFWGKQKYNLHVLV